MAASMRAGDTAKTGTLRLLRGALKNEEIKLGHPLDEAEALKVQAVCARTYALYHVLKGSKHNDCDLCDTIDCQVYNPERIRPTTDAAIAQRPLQLALEDAVAKSFNRITVDGNMSTNDTVLVLANGMAGPKSKVRSRKSKLKRR